MTDETLEQAQARADRLAAGVAQMDAAYEQMRARNEAAEDILQPVVDAAGGLDDRAAAMVACARALAALRGAVGLADPAR